jgi:hypothetical protein
MLALFDAPSRELSVVRREKTETPLQALILLHEPELLEAARLFAEKMFAHDLNPAPAIAHGIFLLYHRAPRTEELAILEQLYQDELADLVAVPENIWPRLQIGEAPRLSPAGAAEHAAMTQVARVLLSTGEAVTKE